MPAVIVVFEAEREFSLSFIEELGRSGILRSLYFNGIRNQRVNPLSTLSGFEIHKVYFVLEEKPKCHHVDERSVQIGRQHSRPLYKLLRKDRWQKFITTDEAWVNLSDTNAKSKVQYLSRDQNRRDLTPSTMVPQPKGVMVWMGISANGVTKTWFVQPGAKINYEYCVQKILKPFLKDDYCRLYPNGDAVLHQDSAPSYAPRVIQKFLTDQQVQFLRLKQRIPNSPEVVPCDYFHGDIWKTNLIRYEFLR
ncbi:hypothetical protein AVEN_32523-1 [Araneus ventricosus]|uniref:Uncharacterized protein n=1 Tax=Araneus ventricosus TaxID=182803 RepID=A0A4Y2GBP5_ARAVE|nr:hypothetical protein AVEN_32523-1 [Araneus ventricosus]